MGAFTDLAAYKAAAAAPHQRVFVAEKNCNAAVGGKWADTWTASPFAGTAPTTAVAPDDATTGSLFNPNNLVNPAGNLWLRRLLNRSNSSVWSGMLYDRLSHQGGIAGTSTGTVTTNLPTAALTRYAGAASVGNLIMLTIYTALTGSTAQTITATYTNQAGTGSRVTPAITIGAAGNLEAGLAKLFPLVSGDTGARSVESVAPSGGLVAGTYGISIIRPLCFFSGSMATEGGVRDSLLGGCGNIPEILADCCLGLLIMNQFNGSFAVDLMADLAEA